MLTLLTCSESDNVTQVAPDSTAARFHYRPARYSERHQTRSIHPAMKLLRDPVILLLSGLLALSLAAYFGKLIPYPFGLLILLVLIAARILHTTNGHRTPK